jgi:hypothetical protein
MTMHAFISEMTVLIPPRTWVVQHGGMTILVVPERHVCILGYRRRSVGVRMSLRWAKRKDSCPKTPGDVERWMVG